MLTLLLPLFLFILTGKKRRCYWAEGQVGYGRVRFTRLPDPDPFGGQVQVGDRILEMGGVSFRRPLTKVQFAEACGRLRTATRPMKVVAELTPEREALKEDGVAAPGGPRAKPPTGEAVFQSAGPAGSHHLHRSRRGYIRFAKLPEPDPYEGRIKVGDRLLEAGGVDLRRPLARKEWAKARRQIRAAPLPLEFVVETRARRAAEAEPAAPAGVDGDGAEPAGPAGVGGDGA